MRKVLTILALFICELSVFGQITEYKNLLTQFSLYSSIEYALPSFSYPSKTTTELKAFMLKYRIDSIAGKGDEFERQINLLKWVNSTFKHSGNTPLPSKLNADTLAIIGRKSGVHCGGLAMILNAAYLSLGFKSRFITCLNNDTTFNDPHTLTIVFSNKFKKWIMIDPTYCAYFIGNENIPLSLEEIRARLASNSKIKLNEEFNLNSVSTTAGSKNDYLEYLTRNMFRFISPIKTEYNWDMDCLDYVNLIPQGYKLGSMPLGKVIVEGCSKIYCIDNQEQFWKE
jgi:hypothetical protein